MLSWLQAIAARLRPTAQPSSFQRCLQDGRAAIGQGSYGDPNVHTFDGDTTTRLEVGNYCSISHDVHILLGGEHRTDWVTTSPLRILNHLPGALEDGHPASKGDVIIGNDVWIGFGATILSGVTIGNGAVVAAGSVVASNIPPFTIVGGNPAKVIRARFTPEMCEALERIGWWNWSHEEVVAAADMLCSSNVLEFVQRFDPNLE
jgi:acetyltransferase-like isoleucine patch superfamily enzyme